MGLLCQGLLCSPVIELTGLVDMILSDQGVISIYKFSGPMEISQLSPLCCCSSRQSSTTHAIATAAKIAILWGFKF